MKILKRFAFIISGIILLGYVCFSILKSNTKKHSPEAIVTHTINDETKVSVYYNRPYKKSRKVFGELVPYNQVWRTGANETTTFTTNKKVLIDGTELPAGTYSLWTIPNQNSWKVIFNEETPTWGVNLKGLANRNPDKDILTIEVPIHTLLNVVNQFSIYFKNAGDITIMYLAWDITSIAIPIKNY